MARGSHPHLPRHVTVRLPNTNVIGASTFSTSSTSITAQFAQTAPTQADNSIYCHGLSCITLPLGCSRCCRLQLGPGLDVRRERWDSCRHIRQTVWGKGDGCERG